MTLQVFKSLATFVSRLFGRKPLLPVRQPVQPRKNSKEDQARIWARFFSPHSIAWRTTFEPMELMLNEPDPVKKNQVTEKWLKNMERHLNIMIITSSVVSSIMASAFSWTTFSNDDSANSACVQLVTAAWYSALILSVSSIAAASQQITSLHRLDLYPDGCEMIHRLLGESVQTPASNNGGSQVGEAATAPPPPVKLRLWQAFLWQIPVMLLNGSLYLFTTGLCILTYWDFTKSFNVSVEVVQVFGICFFTICAIGAIGPWGVSSIGLYHWIGDMLKRHI